MPQRTYLGWVAAAYGGAIAANWSVPEIVHLSVMTPYPGTEIWHTQSRQRWPLGPAECRTASTQA